MTAVTTLRRWPDRGAARGSVLYWHFGWQIIRQIIRLVFVPIAALLWWWASDVDDRYLGPAIALTFVAILWPLWLRVLSRRLQQN